MAYKLMVTAKGCSELSWVVNPDGSPVSRSTLDSKSWLVESNYKDRIYTDDFLKQTGLVWKKCWKTYDYSKCKWVDGKTVIVTIFRK